MGFALNKIAAEHNLNSFIVDKMKNYERLPNDLKQKMFQEAKIMSALGVSNEIDYKSFFYIFLHTGSIAEHILGRRLTDGELAELSAEVFANRYEFPVDSAPNFTKAVRHAISSIKMAKIAYPQGKRNISVDSPHNLERWMQATREIYALTYRGTPFKQAFDHVTQKWDIMEASDFKNWLDFYEENTHNKYKTAQLSSVQLPSYLTTKDLKAKLPMPVPTYIDEAHPDTKAQEIEEKQKIKDVVNALIGRLNSAEKIATKTDDIRNALGHGFKAWLEALHSLKREIQGAPILSSRSALATDLIMRKANELHAGGFLKAAEFMVAVAQEKPNGPGGAPSASSASKPEVKSPPPKPAPSKQQSPLPPSPTIGTPPPLPMPVGPEDSKPAPAPQPNSGKDAMEEFVKKLNGETDGDENSSDDLTVTAQVAPQPTPAVQPSPTAQPTPQQEPAKPATPKDPVESASIGQIISRLEVIENMFKNREIARELTRIDMMMDSAGIAAYFPELAEAIRSALDSNQYCSSRVEGILSKLRGSIDLPESKENALLHRDEVKPSSVGPVNPQAVKQNLEQAEADDAARKAKRKEEEQAKLDNTVTNAPEELAQPTNVQPSPPVNVPNG